MQLRELQISDTAPGGRHDINTQRRVSDSDRHFGSSWCDLVIGIGIGSYASVFKFLQDELNIFELGFRDASAMAVDVLSTA